VYKNGNSRFSYMHHYFASNSDASASLFLCVDC
jgi:hypothetical protein